LAQLALGVGVSQSLNRAKDPEAEFVHIRNFRERRTSRHVA
jgi:hypothetical protein